MSGDFKPRDALTLAVVKAFNDGQSLWCKWGKEPPPAPINAKTNKGFKVSTTGEMRKMAHDLLLLADSVDEFNSSNDFWEEEYD